MFNKKNKTKKEKTIKRKILKIILWVVGIFAVAIIIFLIWFSYNFSCMPSGFVKFFKQIADPCYEVYSSSVVGKGWPKYKIRNDRVCVYVPASCWGQGGGLELISVQGADPKTFEELEFGYSKDKSNVYYDDQKIQDADPNTFEVIKNEYYIDARDKNYNYYRGRIESVSVQGVNLNTFKELDYYGKDKNHRYLYGEKIEE